MEMCNRTRTGPKKAAFTPGSLVPAFQKLDILSNILDNHVPYERQAGPQAKMSLASRDWPGVTSWHRSAMGAALACRRFSLQSKLCNDCSAEERNIRQGRRDPQDDGWHCHRSCCCAGCGPFGHSFSARTGALAALAVADFWRCGGAISVHRGCGKPQNGQCLWESVIHHHSHAEPPVPFELTKGKDAIEAVLRHAVGKCGGNLANMRIIKRLSWLSGLFPVAL
jgi:hypothetical protein